MSVRVRDFRSVYREPFGRRFFCLSWINLLKVLDTIQTAIEITRTDIGICESQWKLWESICTKWPS